MSVDSATSPATIYATSTDFQNGSPIRTQTWPVSVVPAGLSPPSTQGSPAPIPNTSGTPPSADPTITPTTTSSTPSSAASAQGKSTGIIIGVLFGGLIAGALVVIAIFFYLRSRRRRHNTKFDMNEVTAYSSAPAWEAEKQTMSLQLDEAQAERAQLSTYLQLADTQDPRDVVELFDKLNVSVRKSCTLAGGAVLKSILLRSSWTTADATSMKQLHRDLDGADALVLSKRGEGRRPEEFIPHAFCYIVNRALVDNLFGLFHPGASKDENKLLWDMYRDVRSRDPQRLSARWRCLTYSAIDSRIAPSPSNWSNRFADDVLRDLSSIVSSLFGEIPSGAFPMRLRGELASIGAEAYTWNRLVKSTFKSLDFRPVIFTSADPFDPASMTLYQNHKPEFPPRHIVAAVTLALMSTSSVSSGEGTREEYVWKTKAEVLTEGFL